MTSIHRNKMVVAHSVNPHAPQHEVETNRALARWLANILGLSTAAVMTAASMQDGTCICCPRKR